MKKEKNLQVMIKVLSLMKPRLWLYLLVMLVDVILTSVCFNTYQAFLLKDITEACVQEKMFLLVRGILIGVISLTTGIVILPMIKYIKDKCIMKTMYEVKILLYKKLTSLQVSEFEAKHSGTFLYRMTNQVDKIQDVYYSLNNILFAVVYGGIAIICMFILNWRIALVIIILDFSQTMIDAYFVKPMKAKSITMQESDKCFVEKTVDLVDGNIFSRILSIQDILYGKYKKENANNSKCALNQADVLLLHNSIIDCYSNVKYFGLLFLGIFMVFQGKLEIGIIIAMLRLQNDSRFLFGNIGNYMVGIQDPLIGAKEVLQFLTIENEESEEISEVADSNIESFREVEFKDVSFQYKKDSADVIQNVNIEVKQGDKIAIVGQSGSGKSTIAKLLLGFYQVKGGDILLNNISIDQYARKTLRDMIAYVPQNAHLFYGTIEENIKFGCIEADTQKIIEAARLANAHEFIMEQPDGYQTIVGDGGASVSGGQMQRIAIARAILKDAPVLLFDEATSALDSYSEELIQDAINHMKSGKTTITIAHRLATIADSDHIYVMEQGKVIEQGNHNELIKLGGLYAQLCTSIKLEPALSLKR